MGTSVQTSTVTALGLVKYDAACRAIAAARATEQFGSMRTHAAALKVYAQQAKNRALEIDAAEIRIRAERRVGELMDAQRSNGGLNRGAKGSRKVTGSKKNPVKDDRPTLAEAGIDKYLAHRARQLASVPESKFERMVGDWRGRAVLGMDRISSDLLRPPTPLAVHQSSETPEHYTPSIIIEVVTACLGTIDLDPCSNPGTPVVPATRYFTAEDDGLAHAWSGRLYMNPPYGREIDDWVAKLCDAHQSGAVPEAIALLPARTDTQWFQRLRDYLCCFITRRLTFVGNDAPAPFPSMLVYLGTEIGTFYHHASALGDIWQRLEPDMFAD